MEIVLSSIGDKGDINNERIGFKVLKDCELKYFLVYDTYLTSGGFANKSNNVFWFLPQEAKAGDKIVLYTKGGISSISKNNDGSTTYFFYWGLNTPIFKAESDRVVLVSIKSWELLS